MPIISKEAAQRHLDMWMEAEAAVSTGQSYQIEQMMLTRASLKQIRESIIFCLHRRLRFCRSDNHSPAG